MAECSHCDGTGKCQDDFHSGATIFGGLGEKDEYGKVRPSVVNHMFGECPSCGVSNTEMRPPCPHCNGTGGPKSLNPFADETPRRRQEDSRGSSPSYEPSGLPATSTASDYNSTDADSGGLGLIVFILVVAVYFGFSGHFLYQGYHGNFEGTLGGYLFGLFLLPGMLIILLVWMVLALISSLLGLNIIPT